MMIKDESVFIELTKLYCEISKTAMKCINVEVRHNCKLLMSASKCK